MGAQQLVGRLASAIPIVVIIYDYPATDREVRIDPVETQLDRLVPVAIDVSKRHGRRRVQRVIEQALVQSDTRADRSAKLIEDSGDVIV